MAHNGQLQAVPHCFVAQVIGKKIICNNVLNIIHPQKYMQQHTIDETNIDIILETLWAIRDNDKFYFIAYGKELIEQYITNKTKQNEHRNS